MSGAPRALIDGLMNPAVFPHPCNSVELVETHISWILLTGLRAYKIKKPVDFGFVDFTTLERRRHYCEEELRLNRRLAPELYLDVVPITGTEERPSLCGDGPAIEYAVQMLQFDQSRLLSRLPLTELTHSQIDSLADQCAEFHRHAAVAPQDSTFGSPDAVMVPVRDNFGALQSTADSVRDLVQILLLQAEQEFHRLRSSFEERKRRGMIRECHGDLHLGNMFLRDDRITVFDGIDFNEDLRWIDIINDIAFAVMDFDDRGCSSVANRFLNRWLERSGDYAGLNVLPFYCAYRAAVRAKIDAIRSQQPNVSPAEQQHLANDCRGYLELARRYNAANPSALLITTGPSGSGKTTATQQLVEHMNVIRIRSDVERKRLFGLALDEGSPAESKPQMYSPETTAATYDRLAELAGDVMHAGFPVVVDATFLKRAERERFSRLAKHRGVPFVIIRCGGDEDVLKARVRQRQLEGHDASEADVTVLESQLDNTEPLTSQEQQHAVENTDVNLATSIASRIRAR